MRVTHPFHPLFGEELEFVKRRRNWRAAVEWTDVVGEDPFVVVAAGRSPFHTAGLLELAELVARMRVERSADDASSVHRITP